MFNIVSMQDVLLNLKGGEQLFKMFDPPRIRKRSTGSRMSIASKENFEFPIKKVWVLPSHILVLIKTGTREEVIAYDQVPKLTSSCNDGKKLFQDDSAQVFDIFQVKKSKQQEYIVIVLRTGEVVTWLFQKPDYEWQKIRKYSLCKGKDSQIVSYAYDRQTQVLVWCEKRSATQFCICKARMKFSVATEKRTVLFEEVKAVLHNCLPMNIYALSNDVFCFMPVSNKTLGLFMFWSNRADKIVVRMWSNEFNERSYTASTSDYQTIVRDCISLWITYPSSEIKIQSIASHPSSQELIVVQNDLNVYTLQASGSASSTKNNNHIVTVSFVCTLEELNEGKEAFLKQVLVFYPIQRMLLFVMEDGTIIIFENKGGLFLWKTQTFRSGSPLVWLRKGDFPLAGIWNRSGIWNLRPKPISEQLKEFSANRYCVNDEQQNSENNLEKVQAAAAKKNNIGYGGERAATVSDPEFALNLFQQDHQQREKQQQQSRKSKRRLRIKQGVNRSEDVPVDYLFNILNLWQLSNLSMEIALNIATKIKELKESNEDEVDLSEIVCLVKEIKDPVLLLVLFVNKYFPFSVRKQVGCKLRHFLNSNSNHSTATSTTSAATVVQQLSRIEPNILKILQQYVHVDDKIQKCFSDDYRHITDDSPSQSLQTPFQLPPLTNVVGQEFIQLEDVICAGNTSLHSLDKRLCSIMDLHADEFLRRLLNITIGKERLQGTPYQELDTSYVNGTVSKEIWKLFFSESQIYSKICSYLWETSPSMVSVIVKEGQKIQDESADDSPTAGVFQGFLTKTIKLLHLPGGTSNKIPVDLELTSDRDCVTLYCSLLTMLETEVSKERRYDILLNYGKIDEAFEILATYGRGNMALYSLFYQMLCYLLNTKQLGAYAEKLKSLVPENFKMAEFYNVLYNQSTELGRAPVFVKQNQGLSVGELKPFLEMLL